jgi:glycosyltransferase involved in cell wall biosynthesis
MTHIYTIPKVLILVPDIALPGGVANYYDSVKPFFDSNISFFTVGKRKGEKPIQALFRLLSDYNNFKEEVAKNNYDVVLVNPSLNHKSLLRDMIYARYCHAKGIKVITFFRGWSRTMASSLNNQKYLINTFLKSDAIITLSEESRQILYNLGFKRKIYLETTTVSDALLPSMELKKWNDNSFNILFLSRIERAKGVYEAISAYQILKENYSNINLIIAGSGSIAEEVMNFVQQNKISGVSFPGYVKGKEKADLFIKSDVYFFPSSHDEGMPNSVLEAMAFGLPVITRNVGGLQDFFLNNTMGYITDSNDPIIFSELIGTLFKNAEKKKEIGAYNSVFAKDKFIASIVSKRIENIFNHVHNEG